LELNLGSFCHFMMNDSADPHAKTMQLLPSARIARFRLALASKPGDKFFLCHVPTCNTDNSWNSSNLQACEQAKTLWTMVSSRREEGVDAYKIDFARDADAFPEPAWPTQSLNDLIGVTHFLVCPSSIHPPDGCAAHSGALASARAARSSPPICHGRHLALLILRTCTVS
jgi:hypothetical protein